MGAILLFMALGAGAIGGVIVTEADTVMQEIVGVLSFVAAAILLAGAFVCESVDAVRKQIFAIAVHMEERAEREKK